MIWPLFTWILSVGVLSMLWFLYLSRKQDVKEWQPVAQLITRRGSHRH